MLMRWFLIPVVTLALVAPVHAQDVSAEAKELFAKAVTAANAKDFASAANNLKMAYSKDQKVLVLDNGNLDQIAAGLKAAAAAKPGDVQTGKDLGWVYGMQGKYKESLDAYRAVQGAAGEDADLKEQIRIMEAYAAQSGGGGGSSGSSGSTGSGSAPTGGDSGGSSGGSSGSAPAGDGSAASAGGSGGSEEAKNLKEQLTRKEEELEAANKEKEELTKKVAELEAEVKSLQIYKTRINQAGGLR
jgi:tetratricopeptide (TPR) repeat protein